MTIAWPSTLPSPSLSGYQFTPDATTIKTDMDSGPPRVRRRYTSANTPVQATWVLTELQLAVFEAWFVQQAQSGAAWFLVPLRNGLGRQVVTARIPSGAYTAAIAEGGNWRLSAQLEVRDRPLLTPSQLAPYL